MYDPLQRKIISQLNVFIERIGENKFHGGEWPDLADIEVYSSLACRDTSSFWVNFIDHSFQGKLKVWYLNMKRVSQYKKYEDFMISLTDSLPE